MNGQYKQSEEELQQHLKNTLQAIDLSARSYDLGYSGEANRLTAAIRILVHDTSNSKSLLGQLQLLNMQFYDTSIPRHPDTVMTYSGITAVDFTTKEAIHVAPLDDLPAENPPRFVSFDQWWNGLIFVDNAGRKTTRRDLILSVANKDGGAHVDPTLDEKYASLSRQNSLAWRFANAQEDHPMPGPEKCAVRQIAHEVLKSFNTTMLIMKPEVKGALTMGMYAVIDKKQPAVPKVGRNEPCPCGSGRKYKKCHGRV